MPFDNFRADPKPEASSGIAFCADKRLEERFSDFGMNSRSRIRDGQANAGTRSVSVFVRIGDPDLQRTATPNRVQSIPNQVQDHLSEFAGFGNNGRTLAEIPFNDDFGRDQSCLAELKGGVYDFGDLHEDWLYRFPVELKSLGDDLRDPL